VLSPGKTRSAVRDFQSAPIASRKADSRVCSPCEGLPAVARALPTRNPARLTAPGRRTCIPYLVAVALVMVLVSGFVTMLRRLGREVKDTETSLTVRTF